jgi:anaerobic ribonucleoside-triphosphate reductase
VGYIILKCHACGSIRYVREDKKEFTCFTCHATRPVKFARQLGKVEDIKAAIHVVKELKARGA